MLLTSISADRWLSPTRIFSRRRSELICSMILSSIVHLFRVDRQFSWRVRRSSLASSQQIHSNDPGFARIGLHEGAVRNKRQMLRSFTIDDFSSSPIRCERATGLTGDMFFAQFRLKYPVMCYSSSCRQDFLLTIHQSLRMNFQLLPVVMNFTDGQARKVQLKFCTFMKSVPTWTSDRIIDFKKHFSIEDTHNDQVFRILFLFLSLSLCILSIFSKVGWPSVILTHPPVANEQNVYHSIVVEGLV